MRKLNFLKSSLIALSLATTVVSCGDDDNTDVIKTNPDEVISAFIDITYDSSKEEGNQRAGTFFATAKGKAGETVKGRVKFTSDKDMGRLYVTRTLPGSEPEPFVFTLDKKTTKKLTKPDGSIDLDKAEKNAFDFSFDLDVPTSTTAGEIVYNFWATSGRGDFRDPSKRLLVGVGTIDVKVGVAVAQELIVKNNIELKAPLADGTSSTFVSFFDLDRTYKINEGAKVSAFWDFGYFYGATTKASLYSANDYPTAGVNIVEVSNTDRPAGEDEVFKEDLKKVYFKKNTTLSFDTVTLAQINALTVPVSDSKNIKGLVAGDVVEFSDASGRKGLIKVEKVVGTNGTTGTITISVKQIPAAPVMKDGSKF